MTKCQDFAIHFYNIHTLVGQMQVKIRVSVSMNYCHRINYVFKKEYKTIKHTFTPPPPKKRRRPNIEISLILLGIQHSFTVKAAVCFVFSFLKVYTYFKNIRKSSVYLYLSFYMTFLSKLSNLILYKLVNNYSKSILNIVKLFVYNVTM